MQTSVHVRFVVDQRSTYLIFIVTYRFISSSYTKYVNRSPSFEKLKCMLKQTTCEFPSDEKNVTVLSCLFLTNKHHRVLEIITEIIDFFLLK